MAQVWVLTEGNNKEKELKKKKNIQGTKSVRDKNTKDEKNNNTKTLTHTKETRQHKGGQDGCTGMTVTLT